MRNELSVCVEMLFREFGDPMSARQLTAAKTAGINKVEFWLWRNKDIDAIERSLADTGLSVLSMVSQPQGHLVDPAQRNEFLQGVRESIPVAKRLEIPNLVVLSGNAREGVPDLEQREALTEALRAAAPLAEEAGVTLILEPLNTRVDHVGNYLDSTKVALDVLNDVDSPNIRLLYDLYHSVVMDEDPAEVLRGAGHLIGHVQIADHPGRHEPGSGGVDWKREIHALQAVGYSGGIGLEYTPSDGDSIKSLQHIREAITGA
ncbi:hydroxypyruvate isomerase family protein [Arthrobacter sp. ISL-30]|uniref:hydroxypyruvate isomerase family protein n=1 Tax=Arthrobacter sp. ISL-30 TaxID=2819109 RepID=UPI001BE7FCCE|nr:TIM barrel protein [Arthrobacter sp. ISL-30]MBT2512309.1 TIM barrel protein [Arthrobacter sp. ISL-30]